MSRGGRDDRDVDRLDRRLDALQELLDMADGADGRLPDELLDQLRATLEQARTRLGHGTAHTVVALAGATGSGKSSLFNALVGADLAQVGVRRPTTSATQAAVFAADGVLGDQAAGLLDWLGIGTRHVVRAAEGRDALTGLVLLDLPDHDSTAADHRAEVDRLVEVVDAFVWVVDPQKYADLALHEQYLRRFAGHAAVTLVALNQVDQVPADQRRPLLDDLAGLLREDGLGSVRVLATSASTGEGTEELRRELVARVAERRAVVARLDADVDWLAERLAVEVGDRDPEPVSTSARAELARAFTSASGAAAVAGAVSDAHRHRAAQALGWPPIRWVGRLRPDPLRRLGLDRGRADPPGGVAETAVVARTSRPTISRVSEASVASAVRAVADDTGRGLPDQWRRRLAEVSTARRDDVADALDRAIGSTELPTGRPGWWSAVAGLQWALTAVAAAGLLWLIAIGVVAWLGLPDLPTPELRAIPWPTAMLLGGVAAGLLVSLLARAVAAVGARRRGAVALRALGRAAAKSSSELVVAPLDDEVRALAELRRLALGLRSSRDLRQVVIRTNATNPG